MVDFRYLLEAPAGRYGFLRTTSDGHFAWPDGRRAKFWGVNISNRSVFTSKARIDRVVDVLARSGCNMVRFEALDSTDALLDVPGSSSSRAMNVTRLDLLDYWIFRLKERGIYIYLNLLDFRSFKEGDEVAAWDRIGRAAKPYAVFDPRLIELQKEFARQLLTHENPYTRRRLVDEPALAMLELCNEHGLFSRAAQLDEMPDFYAAGLRQRWNRWLVDRHGSRDRLKQAWGSVQGVSVLGDGENPSEFTVKLPNFSRDVIVPPLPGDRPEQVSSVVDVRRAPRRLEDGVRFLYDTQRAYFREMRTFLRSLGLKIPVSAAVSTEIVPDVASVAAELDFTTENYYSDHPTFAGREWEGVFFFDNRNPLRSASVYQVAPFLAALKWVGRPVVIREWATVWPNQFRAVAVPEMAAYAGLQDVDTVLLFGYQVEGKPEELGDFDHQCDPPVWGLFGIGAQVFLRGDVQPAPQRLTITYRPEQMFVWPNRLTEIHRASWFARIESRFVETGSLPISLKGVYAAARELAARPTTTVRRIPIRGRTSRKNRRRVRYRTQVVHLPKPPMPKPNPLGVPAADEAGLGTLLSLWNLWGLPVSGEMLGRQIFRDTGGAVERWMVDGRLTVCTPRFISIAGEFPAERPLRAGGWTVITATPVGAVCIVSLDGRPLAHSRKYIIKMVSRAENSGQVLSPAAAGAPGRYLLKSWGSAPVLTFGRASGSPTRIKRGAEDIVSFGMVDGTWEVVVNNGRAAVVCDTSAVSATVLGSAITTEKDRVIEVASVPGRTASVNSSVGSDLNQPASVPKGARSSRRSEGPPTRHLTQSASSAVRTGGVRSKQQAKRRSSAKTKGGRRVGTAKPRKSLRPR
jgi:hypothetical protein